VRFVVVGYFVVGHRGLRGFCKNVTHGRYSVTVTLTAHVCGRAWRMTDEGQTTWNGPTSIHAEYNIDLLKALQDFAAVQACRG
jgi:hypothetical protein